MHPMQHNPMKILFGTDAPTKNPKIPFKSAPTNKPTENFGLADAYKLIPKASKPSAAGDGDDDEVVAKIETREPKEQQSPENNLYVDADKSGKDDCDSFVGCLKKAIERYKKEKACDKYLSNLFGDEGAYFFDNTFWKDDSIMGFREGKDHSHLYGSENDSSVSTNIYFPAGGTIVSPDNKVPGSKYLGSSRDSYKYKGKNYIEHNANYVLIHYARLGKLRDVTLAIYHVDNFALKKQEDGRTRIGTIGFSGKENYGSGGALGKIGGHSHFELLKGLKRNLANKKLLSFRDICP